MTGGSARSAGGATAASGPRRSRRSPAHERTLAWHQWAHVVILLTLLVGNLIQRPGYTTFDTKLDLTENPGQFMSRALTVWNPSIDMGSLQNQAYGYFFPIGPFFWIGDTIGAPMWLWQRLWSALVMLAAYEGMRRLARAVDGVGPGPAVVAGLAFALAPRLVGVVGVLSAEALPGAILPWTVLPLVHAWHGRWTWRRGILVSAATLPLMSGVNATEVLCTLPLPGLVILCAPLPWRRRLKYGAAWNGLVLLVCAWWIGPLLVLGRYAPPFLDYIESATATTGPLGWLTVLRGTTHWATFLSPNESHWIAGHQLTFQPVLVAVATLLAVVGLIGLATLRSPMRRPFLLAALFGMVVMALGHGGVGGSILSDGMISFLDGPGAPFRNIHKFDPIVRAGLSLGLAGVVAWAAQRSKDVRLRLPGGRALPLATAPAVVGLLLVGVLATPMMQGNLRADDGWTEFPVPLREMQQTLERLPDTSRVLVLPGPGFVDHTWGRTVDEPVQTMPGVNWASRTQIPLVSPGGLRLLEAIEEHTSAGRPSNALAPMLAQAGFTHVLVRNDLNPDTTDVPSSARLHATLRGSAGLRETASYGVGDDGFPMLELYSLTGVVPRARAVQSGGIRELAGESDRLLHLGESGVLAPDELTVTRGSGLPVRGRIVTEGGEKRSRSFGRVHDAVSGVRTENQPWEMRRAAQDYGVIDTRKLTTVDYGPVAAITTSSAADDTNIFGPVRPDQAAWAAFDGVLGTSFRTAPYTDPLGQSIALKLKHRQAIGTVSIVFDRRGANVTSVKVTTDQGTRRQRVTSDGRVTIADLGGSTDDVRIEVDGVARPRPGDADDPVKQQVFFAEINFTSLTPTRTQIVDAPVDSDTTVSLATRPGRPACVAGPQGVRCEPASAMDVEEAGGFSRTLTVRESGRWTVSGLVRVTSGRVVDDLVLPVKAGIAVRSSSSYGGEPLTTAARAVDGDATTGWVSGTGDPGPWLDLSWGEQRTVQNIRSSGTLSLPGDPVEVTGVTADGKPVAFRPVAGGWQLTEPVRASSLRLFFKAPASNRQLAVSEISIAGLQDLIYRAGAKETTGLPCGFGPPITVAGQTVQTRITGQVGDVQGGRLLRVESCTPAVTMTPGRVTVSSKAVPGFVPTGLTLTPQSQAATVVRDVPLSVSSWSEESRRISIGGTEKVLLAIPENINDGWVATVDGKRLNAVTVDGWKQGFVVPEGRNRVVELVYQPGGPYRLALVIGGLAALAIMAAAAYVLATGRGRLDGARRPATAEVAGSAARSAAGGAPPRRPWLIPASAGLGLAVFGGVPVALGFVATALTPRRWRQRLRLALVALATVAAAFWAVSVTTRAVTAPVDIVLGFVVGAAVGTALPALRRPQRSDAPVRPEVTE